MTGIVKFYDAKKGIGFITPDEGGEDIVVFALGLTQPVMEFNRVQFELERGKKGLQAVKVSRI